MASNVKKPTLSKKKLSRAEKRALQREQNPLRALEMRKARLSGVYGTGKEQSAKPKNKQIHIGCSGWYYWDWKGKFYPAQMPTSQWFSYYMQNFDTVELNAPFYSWPTIATVKNWLRQAREKKFIYTVKVSEMITHSKRFTGTKTLIQDFGLIADMLGVHMGCFLYQLPPSFSYTPARLRGILAQLNSAGRNVVEFRHASWWNEKVYAAFRKAGVIFCSCSGPKLPDTLIKTTDDIYVRFHGTEKWYRHNYSEKEIRIWSKRIKDSGAKNIWAYFNNDYGAYAIHNAQLLKKLLAK